MRLSFAAVFAAAVAGVVATEPAEDVSTVMVTETTTYCPSSTPAVCSIYLDKINKIIPIY